MWHTVIEVTCFVIIMTATTLADMLPLSESDKLHCSNGALTGPLGLLVQALLAVIAFGALISKLFLLILVFRC